MAKELTTDELLKKKLQDSQDEKAAIETESAPLRKKRETVQGKIDALKIEENDLTDQINAIERPRIVELAEEISRLALATGGKSMGKSVAE